MDDKTGLGNLAEAKVIAYYTAAGYDVFVPLFGKSAADLVIGKDSVHRTVQVKGCNYRKPNGKYEVQLRSIRSNRTGNNIKKFDGTGIDLVAIYLQDDDRVVEFNGEFLHGRSTITL